MSKPNLYLFFYNFFIYNIYLYNIYNYIQYLWMKLYDMFIFLRAKIIFNYNFLF